MNKPPNPIFFRIRSLELEGLRCVSCENPLDGGQVWGYPHDGGVEVGGHRLWLYVPCEKCGYQNSWRKLGLEPHRHIIEVVEPWETV